VKRAGARRENPHVRAAVPRLTLSALAFGFTTALFTSYMATTLFTTGLAERVGPKRMVGAGLAVSTLGTVVFALSPSYTVAFIAKILQGVGSAFAFVAAARYLAGLCGDRRMRGEEELA
jgi:MFS family permease